LLLGVKGGVDPAMMLNLIQNSAGRSYVADTYGPEILAGTYDASFPIGHAAKDMRLAIEMARVDLAAMYRLSAHFGYDDTVWNHITMRVPGSEHNFFLNKFSLLYNEVAASNLIKVDSEGTVLEGPADVNTAGFVIHSAIHNDFPQRCADSWTRSTPATDNECFCRASRAVRLGLRQQEGEPGSYQNEARTYATIASISPCSSHSPKAGMPPPPVITVSSTYDSGNSPTPSSVCAPCAVPSAP
jgi:hypothetical protein